LEAPFEETNPVRAVRTVRGARATALRPYHVGFLMHRVFHANKCRVLYANQGRVLHTNQVKITVEIPDPMQISGILRGAHATLRAHRAYLIFFHF
jgi:hypothetical protein